jgi:hypothetical protein
MTTASLGSSPRSSYPAPTFAAMRAGIEPPPARDPFRRALLGLYVVSLVVLLALLFAGASFYVTPLAERAHHPGYWDWKAGGRVGRALGVVGAGMMTVMLLYSVRKRLSVLRRVGALSRWLDLHIFLGTIGPLCIVLHSTFKAQGLVSLSYWSMIAVALSGLVGRYLYLQIPRTRAGEALTLAQVEALDQSLGDRLRQRFRLDDSVLKRLEELSTPPADRGGLVRAVLRVTLGDWRLRRQLRGFARECRGVPRPLVGELERVVRQKALLRRRIALWDRLHELFHYWHVIHKPFAVVMYLFMVVHIVVAVMTGYGWSGGS